MSTPSKPDDLAGSSGFNITLKSRVELNEEAEQGAASKLPVELLTKIFLLNAPLPHGDRPDTPVTRAPPLPLQIMSVCRYWKEVALGIPQLWQSLDLDFTSHNRSIGRGIVKWFSRAGSCPLSLAVQLQPHGFMECRVGKVPWSRLTLIDIRGDTKFHYGTMLLILACAPKLVSASFETNGAMGYTSDARNGSTQTILPHLKRLIIKFSCAYRISHVFQTLVLPTLEDLKLEALGSRSSFDDKLPHELSRLQLRSNFSLQYLHLARIRWGSEAILTFFDQIPTLKGLCLKSCDTMSHEYSSLLRMMSYWPGITDYPLPNLEKVEMFDKSVDRQDDGLVLDFLESRRWGPEEEGYAQLDEATIRWCKGRWWSSARQVVMQRRAQSLRDGGMTLTYPALIENEDDEINTRGNI